MGFKEQLLKIKENWLILVLILLLVFFMSGSGLFTSSISRSISGFGADKSMGIAMESIGIADSRGYYPSVSQDFAPEVEERKIIKTASMSTEVERGTFKDSESKLKNIVTSSDSFILNENVNKYGTDRRAYFRGSYQLRIEEDKYESVISQLKDIGEVTSFNENANDVTGRATNLVIEITTEKERLDRYKQMFDEAEDVKDKITLNDRIFEQERKIRYYENQLKNIDQRIDYTSVYFTLTEKQSDYANVVFVKFSELIRSLVSSFNNLISLVFVLLPWAVALLIIGFIWKFTRRNH